MTRFKGTIALDIDGTVTIEKHILEKEVEAFLNSLIKKGWLLVFVTGRTFSFSKPILSGIKGSFFLAVQNGAALYQMPDETMIAKRYVQASRLKLLDSIFEKETNGLLVESGREKGDICFYKPHNFSEQELDYIKFRMQISPETWVAVESFEELNLADFAVGKFFAQKEKAEEIARRIQETSAQAFNIVIIRDPFRQGWHLAHINEKRASKGAILEELAHFGAITIAAGDDYNDVEMLKKAKIKIAMQNAPQELIKQADILAKPASDQGIISALKEAIEKWKG